jgi:hypothetical protein
MSDQPLPLECESVDRLAEVARRVADAHREPALVMLVQPATGYGSGCRLAYVTLASQANEFERKFAHAEVLPS